VAAVWLKPDGFAYASSFKPSQLRSDRVLTDLGEHITMDEFFRVAVDSCDGKIDEE
jgi:hypothetical protein